VGCLQTAQARALGGLRAGQLGPVALALSGGDAAANEDDGRPERDDPGRDGAEHDDAAAAAQARRARPHRAPAAGAPLARRVLAESAVRAGPRHR
jgi:hypothetical protein